MDIEQYMRDAEQHYESQIDLGKWIIVRLDGRNFSSLTQKHYTKPFDLRFHTLMVETTKHLLTEFYGIYAYVASDEISLLFSPTWDTFDRRVEKATTLIASTASVYFSLAVQHSATFDARIIPLDSLPDVAVYFIWRFCDVERCALQTATYWTLRNQDTLTPRQTTKLLDGASVDKKRDILSNHDIDYSTLPTWQRQGVGLHWEEYQKEGYNPITEQTVMATRKRICYFDDFQSREYYRQWLQCILGKEQP